MVGWATKALRDHSAKVRSPAAMNRDVIMDSVPTTRFAAFLRTKIGVRRIAGTPLLVHWSWFPGLVVLVILVSRNYSSWFWALGEILGIFLFIAMHEFGHIFVMRWLGYKPKEIVLWALGGAAVSEMPRSWSGELKVAAVGPAVNLMLVPITVMIWWSFGDGRQGDLGQMLYRLVWANLGILLFNLLPIWPLDGGRIFEALMRPRFGLTRSRFAGGILGVVVAAIGSAWSFHVHAYLAVAVFSALICLSATLMEWCTAMSMAERKLGIHESAICPSCGSRGLGEDWKYSATAGLIECHYCGQTSDGADWLATCPRPG
jgi:Zn-dependent protease